MIIKRVWKYKARKQLVVSMPEKEANKNGIFEGDYVKIEKAK